MSAYLFLQRKNNILVSYIHENASPEQLGVSLIKYFNNTHNVKSLFKKQRIQHIENGNIIPMTTQQIMNSGFNIFTQLSISNIQESLELLCYSIEIRFTYVFQYETDWTCYACYNHENKRIIEEIHLYTDYFRNLL